MGEYTGELLFVYSCTLDGNIKSSEEEGRRRCLCSDEEKSSQQESGVDAEVGGVALLHEAGAVTPGEEN